MPKALGRSLALAGSGATLTARATGETLGAETHTLTAAESAALTYTVNAANTAGGQVLPSGKYPGQDGVTGVYSATKDTAMAVDMVTDNGGGGAHNNMQPTSFLNAMIKL